MSLFDLVTKVELLLHFAGTVVKHAKELKDELKNAHEDDEQDELEEPEEIEISDEEEGDEEGPNCKKRKKDSAQ